MEEKSENPIRFQFVSEFNNEVLVARRKNLNKKLGFLLLVCSIFFILPIFAIIFVSKDPSTFAALGFLGFTIFSIGSSVYYFTKNERNIKNADKTITYTFYEDFVEIIKNSGNKNKKGKLIASCLYKNSFSTQTVAKITEFDDLQISRFLERLYFRITD
ncbi:hypothetical protein [Candidatus Ruminimicrobium bovinum]|uniref:hypothetical protein n=1 Tax=Candidatus Ruminimicrobium bovinum TaxID=3242779 RepID=UPI0039B8BDCA